MSQHTSEQKATIREFIDVINDHDVGAVEDVMDANLTIEGTTDIDSRAEFEQFLRGVYSAFPDFAFSLDEVLAEDDTVAFRTTVTGTHEGEFEGIPATGNEFEYTASFFCQLKDGKLAHVRYDADRVKLMEDLGVMD